MSVQVFKKVGQMAANGAKTIKAAKKQESIHAVHLRSHLVRGAGMALVATTMGALALLSFRRAGECVEAHKQWKRKDRQLDDAINDSLDASDPVAKY